MPTAYGLIGNPLTHSFSPKWFLEKFKRENIDATYTAFSLSSVSQLPALIEANNLAGLNVTIPYKERVIPYLDELDETATKAGAVNCIKIARGIKKGYNTDVTGFENSLLPLLQPHHRRALVLGTGGAAKAITYVLNKLGIIYHTVSRSNGQETLSYEELTPTLIKEHTVIINTTPLGMYPDINSFPVLPYNAIDSRHILYDLIYNPEETKFMAMGKERGATVKNGYEMLLLQAEASWTIWNTHITSY